MPDIPSWVATTVAACIGFLVSYAALRATVASLKDQVLRMQDTMDRLQGLVYTLQADLHAVRAVQGVQLHLVPTEREPE